MTFEELNKAAEQLMSEGLIGGFTIKGEDYDFHGAEITEEELLAALERYTSPLPSKVSNLAFKKALIEYDIFPAAVESLLAQISDARQRWQAKVRWQKSDIALADPLLNAQAAAFGLTTEQLTDIFTRAVEIERETT